MRGTSSSPGSRSNTRLNPSARPVPCPRQAGTGPRPLRARKGPRPLQARIGPLLRGAGRKAGGTPRGCKAFSFVRAPQPSPKATAGPEPSPPPCAGPGPAARVLPSLPGLVSRPGVQEPGPRASRDIGPFPSPGLPATFGSLSSPRASRDIRIALEPQGFPRHRTDPEPSDILAMPGRVQGPHGLPPPQGTAPGPPATPCLARLPSSLSPRSGPGSVAPDIPKKPGQVPGPSELRPYCRSGSGTLRAPSRLPVRFRAPPGPVQATGKVPGPSGPHPGYLPGAGPKVIAAATDPIPRPRTSPRRRGGLSDPARPCNAGPASAPPVFLPASGQVPSHHGIPPPGTSRGSEPSRTPSHPGPGSEPGVIASLVLTQRSRPSKRYRILPSIPAPP
jgi:hypothetical protein